MLAAIETYNPQIVVLPDLLLQAWHHTWEAAMTFIEECDEHLEGRELMYCPQSEPGELKAWYHGLYHMLEDGIYLDWVGLPRALATHIYPNDPYIRVRIAEEIKERFPLIRLHALGMAAGNVHELPLLAGVGVKSIDSSAPVWRGWNGYYLTDPKWPDYPVDFDIGPHYPRYDHIISANLHLVGVTVT